MKKIFGVLGFLILVVIALSYVLQKETDEEHIAIVTFVEHPVLNMIEKSFRDSFARMTEEGSYNITTTSAQGRVENLPSISRTVTVQKPEVIITISTPVSQAMMREVDDNQKIVYTFVTNPGDLGDELTRTNSTGLSDAVNYAENLRLIQKLYGENVTIGMVYNPNEANSVFGIQQVEQLLQGTGAKLVKATVSQEGEVSDVVRQIANVVDVIYVGGDNTTVGAISAVLSSAYEKGIPVIASDSGSVEAGALAGVSVDYEKLGSETATVVRKVLDGTDPRAVPRVTLKGDKLIVNYISAKRNKIELPEWLREEADEVIDDIVE